ncbi:uncharacterized protein [Prorops nasuta]|uniref:uncharacterized protein n=1 Tax=Prorops nasuta TaxID=863751 RepID=UPI0034CFF581
MQHFGRPLSVNYTFCKLEFLKYSRGFIFFEHPFMALIKKAQNLSLINQTINKKVYPERFIIIKKMILLALLPQNYIIGTFQLLRKMAESQFGNFFENYFSYYEKFWIKEIKPANFSVYKLENRTNNFSESYNSRLNKHLGKRPDINSFISYLVMILQEKKDEFSQIKNNTYKPREKKRKDLDFNKEILEFYNNIEKNETNEDIEMKIIRFMDEFSCIKELIEQDKINMFNALTNMGHQEGKTEILDKANIPKIILNKNEPNVIINKLITIKNKYLQNSEEIAFVITKNDTE